jgi:dGTPase
MLADYAVRVEQSRGRRIPEPQHPYRNDFQRDRDRVIHSRAFAAWKPRPRSSPGAFSDHFRNRLTHTIEVAQIARTIAAQPGLNVTWSKPWPWFTTSAIRPWARRREGARRGHA